MRLVSPGAMTLDLLKFLFLFFDLLVKIWLLNAKLRLIFPVPVFRKRLAAPLFVFILGIQIPLGVIPAHLNG